jgi:hypothetical protein
MRQRENRREDDHRNADKVRRNIATIAMVCGVLRDVLFEIAHDVIGQVGEVIAG